MSNMNIGGYETESGSGLEIGHTYQRERETKSVSDRLKTLNQRILKIIIIIASTSVLICI